MTTKRDDVVLALEALEKILDGRDRSSPLLRQAREYLAEIHRAHLIEGIRFSDLPHRSFFFGMHDGQLALEYIDDVELMSGISNLNSAIKSSS